MFTAFWRWRSRMGASAVCTTRTNRHNNCTLLSNISRCIYVFVASSARVQIIGGAARSETVGVRALGIIYSYMYRKTYIGKPTTRTFFPFHRPPNSFWGRARGCAARPFRGGTPSISFNDNCKQPLIRCEDDVLRAPVVLL